MLATKIKIVRDTWQPPTQKLSALPGASRWGLKFQAKIALSFLGAILLS